MNENKYKVPAGTFVARNKDGLIDNKETAKRAASLAFTVILLLLIFSVSALSSMIQFRFSFHSIEWWGFFTLIATRTTMQLLSKYFGAETRVQRGKDEDRYIKAKNEYLEKSRQVDAADFYDWIDAENYRMKCETYRQKNDRKIEKLRRKLSYISYKAKKTTEDKYKKRMDRLSGRIADLQAINTTAYIEANIAHIYVKYRPLRAQDFLSPSDSINQNAIYSMDSHKSNMIGVAKSIPASLLIALFLATVSMSYYFGTLNIVSVLFDILSVAVNLFLGLFVEGERTLVSMINVFVNRKIVLCRYFKTANAASTTE